MSRVCRDIRVVAVHLFTRCYANADGSPTARWAGFVAVVTRPARIPYLLAWALCTLAPAFAQDKQPAIVYVAPVEGMIDLGLAPFVQRVLDDATNARAAAVILEINTFGGRVDAAVQVRDALLNARVRTVAFVNKRAISAGALISLAAENVVMSGGGTLGAAMPVQGGAPVPTRCRSPRRRSRMCERSSERRPRRASDRSSLPRPWWTRM
jgi:membrane-bound ClpP family serine protease